MYTDFKLVRDPMRPNAATPYPTFGDLLKAKAAEGVRVLCMVWDDRTSVAYGMINTGGRAPCRSRHPIRGLEPLFSFSIRVQGPTAIAASIPCMKHGAQRAALEAPKAPCCWLYDRQ